MLADFSHPLLHKKFCHRQPLRRVPLPVMQSSWLIPPETAPNPLPFPFLLSDLSINNQ